MTAADWLTQRVPDAPPALLREMLASLPAGTASVPDVLAAGAMVLFARVVEHGDGSRADALPLLAADALLTHALQAQAEQEPAALAAFCRRWGGEGRLGELASEHAP